MLGIDVSKDTLACALLDAQRHLVWEATLPNAAAGIATLLGKVSEEIPWVLEPTGRYGQQVARLAREARREVRLASPRKAKQFLASIQSRAKTDRLDSRGLALFGLACSLPAYPLKETDVDTLDQLLSARKGLAKSITNLQLQQQSLPEAASVLAPAIADLQTHLRALDKQIAQQTHTTPAFAAVPRLDAVPGIGPVTATAVCSRLASKAFAHPDQFVAYIGLDIGVRQSGQHCGETGLTKQGDAELRRLLYCAAQSNLRCKESPFKDQFVRERAKGLSKTAALCAVARKLAKVCWSLHKHGTEYEASRVAQQVPPKGETAKPHETQNPGPEPTILQPALDKLP
jgi:transposase